MAFASWLNIPVADFRGAAVYRVWKAVEDLLASDMAGKWTVVDTSDGASPGWSSDSSPGDGDWVVIQCETANADASKVQVFVGIRTTTGALAGFGSKAAGIWFACSPIGGWNAAGYFGASLADWRNSSLQTLGNVTSAVTLMLVLTGGDSVNHRPGAFHCFYRSGSGSHIGYSCRMLLPQTGGTYNKSRFAYSFWSDPTHYYNASKNFVARTTMDGWDGAVFGDPDATELQAIKMDAEDSAWVAAPLVCTDTTIAKSRGRCEWPRRIGAANGDLNGVVGSADGWVWDGMMWPREPSRDGAWV